MQPANTKLKNLLAFAATLGGSVLNVVKVDVPANLKWASANVNFYTPGIVTGQNVKAPLTMLEGRTVAGSLEQTLFKVYTYADDTWTECNVTEVRDDHVVVDIKIYAIFMQQTQREIKNCTNRIDMSFKILD